MLWWMVSVASEVTKATLAVPQTCTVCAYSPDRALDEIQTLQFEDTEISIFIEQFTGWDQRVCPNVVLCNLKPRRTAKPLGGPVRC